MFVTPFAGAEFEDAAGGAQAAVDGGGFGSTVFDAALFLLVFDIVLQSLGVDLVDVVVADKGHDFFQVVNVGGHAFLFDPFDVHGGGFAEGDAGGFAVDDTVFGFFYPSAGALFGFGVVVGAGAAVDAAIVGDDLIQYPDAVFALDESG